MHRINNTITEIIELENNTTVSLINNNNSSNINNSFLGLGEVLGGPFNITYIRTMLENNTRGNTSVPAIAIIENEEPLDLPNFQEINRILSESERLRFLNSVFNPDNISSNPIFNLVPYLTIDSNDHNNIILAILFANIHNESLLSFIHQLINLDHVTLQSVGQLTRIINIFIYFTVSSNNDINIYNFIQELRISFTQVYQYNFFDTIRLNYMTTLESIQEGIFRVHEHMDYNRELSQNIILNNRDEINQNINQLSNLINRRQIINTIVFTALNMLLVNQMGLNPLTLFYQIQSFIPPRDNILNQQVSTLTDDTIRLRDIYDLILEKCYSFIKN